MWNEPTEDELERVPALYSTDGTPLAEKLVYMHFFLGGSDWYASEYSARDRLFFGYAILNNDSQSAEWGYFALDELRQVRTPEGFEIDRDLYWRIRMAKDIERMRSG